MDKKQKQVTNPRVISAIKNLQNRRGLILPESVVEAARPASSPLHKYFEWDNTKAAQEWRLEQARYLIRVCVEVAKLPNNEPQEIRVFVSLPSERNKKGGYRLMVNVLSDVERREEMLQMALDELTRLRSKYAKLRELSSIFQAIDRVAKRKSR